MASVEQWAQRLGYDYRVVGDEIFDTVPAWYLAKVGTRLPIATDYGRLVLLQQALSAGYAEVLWLDADMLIFDQQLQPAVEGSCAFSQEVWIQQNKEGLQARRNVSNALCLFRQGCPVLPFLLHTVASLVRRVDASRIAPQFVGPKLLNALHPLCEFALVPEVGALSPLVLADLCGGDGAALALLRDRSARPLQAVNLCASLIDTASAATVIARLLQAGRL